jgi:hypothetical protein
MGFLVISITMANNQHFDVAELHRINLLGSETEFDSFAWLASAILANLDLHVRLTEHANEFIEHIRADSVLRARFESAIKQISTKNEFGFTEIEPDEATRVLAFVYKRP